MEYIFSDKMASLQPSAIREIFKFLTDPTVISFAAGNPAEDAFPVEKIKLITSEIMEENPIAALQYSISEGYIPLRNTMKSFLKSRYNIGTENDELIIVSGAQQGIELTCKCLCNEGDVVICESPSFIGSLNSFRSYNARLVGVDIEDDGINIEKLENALKTNKNVKFIYVIPNFQNPTGVTMSLEKRKAVLALAEKYSVLILEDNPYGDLRFDGEDVSSIKSLDTKGHVIYCGSFSKLLSPGLRVGYVVAPHEIISKMTVAKQTADVHTNVLAQIICDKFINTTDMDVYVKNLSSIYKEKCYLMLSYMDECFGGKIKYLRPQGGLFIWCDLPEGADMFDFCKKAIVRKVAVVPGSAFLTDESQKTLSFRLNFSTPSNERIIRGIEILGELINELY